MAHLQSVVRNQFQKLKKTTVLLTVLSVWLIQPHGFASDSVVPKHNMNEADPFQYSFINASGVTVIDASEFQAVGAFSDGLAPVLSVGKGWGFIDKRGQIVIQPRFNEVRDFSEGLAAVQVGEKWGFVDKAGRIVIEPRYEYVNSFSEGLAIVVKAATESKNRPPRPTGSETTVRKTVPRSVDLAGPSTSNSVRPDVVGIDATGRTVDSFDTRAIDLNVYEGARFSEGVIDASDSKSGKVGFVDKSGRFVIPPQFDEAGPFSEGLARVAVSEGGRQKVGFIDRSGKFQIPPKFNTDADFRNSSDFSEGLAAITENLQPTSTQSEKFAYINRNGEIALLTDYFLAGPFRNGLAVVYDQESDQWGFINKSGKVAIPIRYMAASSFSDGLAVVATLRK